MRDKKKQTMANPKIQMEHKHKLNDGKAQTQEAYRKRTSKLKHRQLNKSFKKTNGHG